MKFTAVAAQELWRPQYSTCLFALAIVALAYGFFAVNVNSSQGWVVIFPLLVIAGVVGAARRATSALAGIPRTSVSSANGGLEVSVINTGRVDNARVDNARGVLPTLGLPKNIMVASVAVYAGLVIIWIWYSLLFDKSVTSAHWIPNVDDASCPRANKTVATQVFVTWLALCCVSLAGLVGVHLSRDVDNLVQLQQLVEDVPYAMDVFSATRTVRGMSITSPRFYLILAVSVLPPLFPAMVSYTGTAMPGSQGRYTTLAGKTQFIHNCPDASSWVLWFLSTLIIMVSVFLLLQYFDAIALAFTRAAKMRAKLGGQKLHTFEQLRDWIRLRRYVVEHSCLPLFDAAQPLVAACLFLTMVMIAWIVFTAFSSERGLNAFGNTGAVFICTYAVVFTFSAVWILFAMVSVSKAQKQHAKHLKLQLLELRLQDRPETHDKFENVCLLAIDMMQTQDTYPGVFGLSVQPALLNVVGGYIAAAILSLIIQALKSYAV